MQFKGNFEVFEEAPEGRRELGDSPNRLMYDGAEFIIDFTFGSESWFSGAAGYDGSLPASGAYHPYRWIALGYSNDDNDDWLLSCGWCTTGGNDGEGSGIIDGSGIKANSVPTGEYISHFPNQNDVYMSSLDVTKTNKNVGSGLFYKIANKIIRTGRQITVEATFNTTSDQSLGSATTIPTGTKIRELGIFLAEPTGIGNPSTVRENRTGAMIVKSVRYQVSGGYIQDDPIIVPANNITVRYTFMVI